MRPHTPTPARQNHRPLTEPLEPRRLFALTDGLVAWYPMDGDAFNKGPIDNHYTATLEGSPAPVPDRAGNPNAALSFDGVDDVLHTNQQLSYWLGGTASLSFWIKTTSAGHVSPIGIRAVTGRMVGSYAIFGSLNADGHLLASLGSNPITFAPFARSATPVNDGNWHHAVITRDATTRTLQIFVDGVPGSAVVSGGIDRFGFLFQSIGAVEMVTGDRHFRADLDDLRIYDRVLTPAEVGELASLPAAVENRAPAMPGQLVVPIKAAGTPTFTWNPVTDPENDPLTYTVVIDRIYVGPSEDWIPAFRTHSTTGTSVTPDDLPPGTYRVRLRANDGNGNTSTGATWDVAVNTPVSAALISPSGANVRNPHPTLHWESREPDRDHLTHTITITGNALPQPRTYVITTGVASGTGNVLRSFTLPAPLPPGEYAWTVTVTDYLPRHHLLHVPDRPRTIHRPPARRRRAPRPAQHRPEPLRHPHPHRRLRLRRPRRVLRRPQRQRPDRPRDRPPPRHRRRPRRRLVRPRAPHHPRAPHDPRPRRRRRR